MDTRIIDTQKAYLPVPLTAEEIQQRVSDLVGEMEKREIAEEQIKAAAARAKSDLAAMLREIVRLGSIVRRGTEDRLTDTRTVLSYDRRVVETIRLDTGEVVNTRSATLDELQQPIPFEPKVLEGASS